MHRASFWECRELTGLFSSGFTCFARDRRMHYTRKGMNAELVLFGYRCDLIAALCRPTVLPQCGKHHAATVLHPASRAA